MSSNNKDGGSFFPNVLASGAAGIIARIFTHPLDTAKARMQAIRLPPSPSPTTTTTGLSSTYRGPIHVLQSTLQVEGFAGLYRGFGAVVIGGTPGTVLYLTSYDLAKDRLSLLAFPATSSSSNSNKDTTTNTGTTLSSSPSESLMREFAVHFSSGMIAEAVACIVYVPVDVIKERLQVQHPTDKLAYRGSWDALQTIARREGIPALYKGYGATLLSFGSYSGFFFVLYEQMQSQVKTYFYDYPLLGPKDNNAVTLPFHWTLACSCGASSLASWITSPLDMAKLRLQVQRGQITGGGGSETSTVLYRNVWECLVHSYRQGGMAGLFRGAGARVLHIAPATTVTITSYEICRSFLRTKKTTLVE
ncbi:hypothetical protein ACA910_016684 [Epithemia clementina (nom. ined.)]